MTANILFGQFISEKRIQNSMTKQELARQIGISTAYLSQIESGVRSNPKEYIILRLINCLHLKEDEIYLLYDLYAAATNTLAIDVARYIKKNALAVKAIRAAEKYGAEESDWIRFIEQFSK